MGRHGAGVGGKAVVNMILGYRFHSDAATLSGGSWSVTLPLVNLQNKEIPKIARTIDTALASTQFDVDLGGQELIAQLVLVKHNATPTARWRVRIGDDPTFGTTLYDSGFNDIWPEIMPFGEGDWGEFAWGGRLSVEEASTYPTYAFVLLSAAVRARYLRVEIEDTGNPAGYVEIGRLLVFKGWTPTFNLSQGWTIEQVDESPRQRSKGKQLYVDQEPRYRRLELALEYNDEDEMLSQAYEIDRFKGLSGDLMVVVDPDDARHRHRKAIYCVLAEITEVVMFRRRVPKRFRFEELI